MRLVFLLSGNKRVIQFDYYTLLKKIRLENLVKNKEICNFVTVNFKYKCMATATKQIKKQIEKQIDWQFPNEKEMTTIEDFKEMVRHGENAPHISFEEFCKVSEEWLSK